MKKNSKQKAKKHLSQRMKRSKPSRKVFGYSVPTEDADWIRAKQLREPPRDEGRILAERGGKLNLWNEEERQIATQITIASLANRKKNRAKVLAKIASLDLPDFGEVIYLAAVNNDKRFFTYLGKYLRDKRTPEVVSRRELAVISVILENPGISSADALRKMANRGFSMSKDGWRNEKMRFLRASGARVTQAQDISSAHLVVEYRKRKDIQRP